MSRFQSSNHPSDVTSLEEYLERMKDKQEHIYFMAAPSRAEAESSPFVERLLRKGYEVLYLVDPVDEYTTQVSSRHAACCRVCYIHVPCLGVHACTCCMHGD